MYSSSDNFMTYPWLLDKLRIYELCYVNQCAVSQIVTVTSARHFWLTGSVERLSGHVDTKLLVATSKNWSRNIQKLPASSG